jgi:Zn-dependent protease
VRVKFWFWLVLLLLSGNPDTEAALIWLAVGFISILIHEMGHVAAYRVFGETSDVVLYAFGGAVIPHHAVRGRRAQILTSLAGPAAGFVVAALALMAAWAVGGEVRFAFHTLLPALGVLPPGDVTALPSSTRYLYVLLNDVLWINFFWGLVNLLPVYPLDGGQAARVLFEQKDPYRGRRTSLLFSTGVAAAITLVGIASQSLYLAVLFGILAVSGVQALEADGGRPAPRTYRSMR